MGLRTWLRDLMAGSPAQIEARLDSIKARIFALSAEDAEREVAAWLADPADEAAPVELEPATSPVGSDRLPPGTGRLLARYSVLDTGGGTRIAHNEVEPLDDGIHVAIGSALEHAILVVRRDTESVWILEPRDLRERKWPSPYPSVWHLLLVERETVKPEWWLEPDAE